MTSVTERYVYRSQQKILDSSALEPEMSHDQGHVTETYKITHECHIVLIYVYMTLLTNSKLETMKKSSTYLH